MTEENPYAPPKSGDLSPEQAYKPRITDKLARIVWAGIVTCSFFIMYLKFSDNLMIFDYYWTSYLWNDDYFEKLFWGSLFFMTIPYWIFLIITEKFCSTITQKIIYTLDYTILCITMFSLLAFVLGGNRFDIIEFILAIVLMYADFFPIAIILALLLHAHYQYYKKKYFQAA